MGRTARELAPSSSDRTDGVTEWPTMALKFLRMLLYRGSCDCTRPTSSLARDIRVYVPFWRTSQRDDHRTHINRSRGCSMWAECQVSPPSTLTSTWSMAPAPLQA